MIQLISRSFGLDQLKGQGLSVLYLSLMASLILMSYGLARGPSEILFLADFSHTLLPGLWIEVGVGVICVVALYNYLLRFLELKGMFTLSCLVTGVSLLGIVYGQWGGEARVFDLWGVKLPWGQTTLLRIWCDLYIVVFVEVFWSIANLRFPLKKATHIYGLLCAGGTLGSIAGNTLVASKALGAPQTYVLSSLITLPLLVILSMLVHRHWDHASAQATSQDTQRADGDTSVRTARDDQARAKSSLVEGLKLIVKSRYLVWILALVMLSQITVSLIDYEYKRYLRELYLLGPETDFTRGLYSSIEWGALPHRLSAWWTMMMEGGGVSSLDGQLLSGALDELRELKESSRSGMTAFQGWMYLSIDMGSLVCQLLTGWIILRLGIAKTHLGIPLILLTLTISALVFPALLLVAATRSAGKFLTYSIFKSAKELLYVPLSYAEQTQGKAIIDIMVYRQAKILASVMLLPAIGLVTLGVTRLTIFTLILWLLVVLRLRSIMGESAERTESS